MNQGYLAACKGLATVRSAIAQFVHSAAAALLAGAFLIAASSPLAAAPVKVLFVGNSLTNRNDLPGTFKAYVMTGRPDLQIQTRMIAPDGETLSGHRTRGEVEKAISSEKWDYVVLQEGFDLVPQYTLNGVSYRTPPTRFFEQQAFFSSLAKKHGATPVVFEVWAEKESFAFIDYASMKAAESGHALIAPIGRVWRAVEERGNIGLVGTDGIHPNPTGTYLLAATIAETLFGTSLKHKQDPETLPAGTTTTDARIIRESASREARSLRKRGGYDRLEVPNYAPEAPEFGSLEGINDNIAGLWRAKDGGIRLSFGTEIEIRRREGQWWLRLRDFSTSALLEPEIGDLQVGRNSLGFKVVAGSVHYTVQLAPQHGALQILTGYNSNRTHRIYRLVSYEQEHEDPYFDRLHELYAALATNEHELGLAAALKQHYERLHGLTDEETFKRNRQGFPISEWDPIIVAMYYSDKNEHARALDYYKAAVELYPDSVDANTYYGKGLVAAGRRAEARQPLERALSLNAGKSAEMTAMIEDELTGIESR